MHKKYRQKCLQLWWMNKLMSGQILCHCYSRNVHPTRNILPCHKAHIGRQRHPKWQWTYQQFAMGEFSYFCRTHKCRMQWLTSLWMAGQIQNAFWSKIQSSLLWTERWYSAKDCRQHEKEISAAAEETPTTKLKLGVEKLKLDTLYRQHCKTTLECTSMVCTAEIHLAAISFHWSTSAGKFSTFTFESFYWGAKMIYL